MNESFDRSLIINSAWMINAGLKGKAAITNYTIPEIVKRENNAQIHVELEESLLKGYVELLVIGIKGQIHKDTYCMLGYKMRDAEDKSGKRKRGIIWDMTIPKEAERGNYKAIVIIYDVETKRWLAYREKSIEVE